MDNNFDFLVGTWTSKQRRLREVLAGSTDWYEFSGTHKCWTALDGAVSFDEALFPELGYGGVTLRLYDNARDEWSLYWANSKTGLLAMPPNVGRFNEDGRGEFYCDEVYEGKQIKVLYLWKDITATSCRWEQAFSVDDGATWETNWVADFTRVS